MTKELCLKCGARAVAHDAQGDPYCEGHGGRALLEQPTNERRDEIERECAAEPQIPVEPSAIPPNVRPIRPPTGDEIDAGLRCDHGKMPWDGCDECPPYYGPFLADSFRIAAYVDAQVEKALEEAERAIVESASRYNSSGYTASKTWVLIGFGYAQGAVRALLAARKEGGV